jgi:cell division protein FtsX
VARIAGLYGSRFELAGLRPVGAAALIGGGIALGWLGSFIAATRQLRGIEPK